ncbi:hypothetical protein [Methylococcus sp. EFPC2]|uniref:hypothetical protein n=1 Tax=Methylococcus sp. EFPC2 TaxID=2812648 RepID=UPI00196755CD|nr:hypothetical protein [Methylococcus sp. EFPC2]QSA96306.1 hypothetical protein JWZ97_13895 [Methylococcus sp. EFPC2]
MDKYQRPRVAEGEPASALAGMAAVLRSAAVQFEYIQAAAVRTNDSLDFEKSGLSRLTGIGKDERLLRPNTCRLHYEGI